MGKLIALVAGLVAGAAAMWFAAGPSGAREQAGIDQIAAASLRAVERQDQLTAYAARFVVATRVRQKLPNGDFRWRTLVVPATVRYQIDYGRMKSGDLDWDSGARTLSVRMPDIEISRPQIDIAGIRELGGTGVLVEIADAGQARSGNAAQTVRSAVLDEADGTIFLQLAKDAARTEVTRAFSLPLEAAGYQARVIVRFPDEFGSGL
jgi:hypothetical protein